MSMQIYGNYMRCLLCTVCWIDIIKEICFQCFCFCIHRLPADNQTPPWTKIGTLDADREQMYHSYSTATTCWVNIPARSKPFAMPTTTCEEKKKLKQTFPFTRRVYSKMNSFTGWSSSRQTTPSWHSRCWCFWYLLDVSVYGSWWWLPAQMWNRLFIYAHFQAGISLSTTRSLAKYSLVRVYSNPFPFFIQNGQVSWVIRRNRSS